MDSLMIKNYILLASGLLNLAMSLFILLRCQRTKINWSYAALTFFCFTWSAGLFLSRSIYELNIVGLFARSTYISAIAIIISLVYFTLYFPYQYRQFNIVHRIFIWLPGIVLSIFIYTKWFIVSTVRAYSEYEYISYYYKPGFLLYAIYFVLLAIYSIYILSSKLKTAEGLVRKQVKLLLCTIIVGLLFGSYFDLFLEYFNDYRFNWLGPAFTVFMNMSVFYLIFFQGKKIRIN